MNFSQSTIFSVIASFGFLVINMLINVFESRVLGPTEIGRYHVYITTQTMFATFCALGIGQSCIYFINSLRIDERKVLASTVKPMIPIAAIASLVLFLILNTEYFGKQKFLYVSIFSLGTFAVLLNNIFTPILLAKMEVVKNQIVKYSARIITLVSICILFLLYGNLNVGILLCLTGITNVISLFILYYYFRNRFSIKDSIDSKLLKKIIKWGIKLSGNNITSLILTSIPVYFLTWFSVKDGFLNVGYYSRANSLLVIGTVIASSVGPLLYSKWSSVKGTELKIQVRRVSMVFIIVNSLIAFLLIVMAPIIVSVLYGLDFRQSIPILQILSFSLIGNGIKEVCYGVLSSQGEPIKILKNLLIGILASLILHYTLICRLGVMGCAISTVFVIFVTAILLVRDACSISQIRYVDFFCIPNKSDFRQMINSVFNR